MLPRFINLIQPKFFLSEQDLKCLKEIINKLEHGKSLQHMSSTDWRVLSLISFEWPEQNQFPGLDVIRLICLHTSVLFSLSENTLFANLTNLVTLESLPVDKSTQTNAMLALKLFCNMFSVKDSLDLIYKSKEQVVDTNLDIRKY